MPSSSSAAGAVGQHAEQGRRRERRVQEVNRAQVGAAPRRASARGARSGSPARTRGALAARGGHHVRHGGVVGPVPLPCRPPVAVEAGPVGQVEEVVVAVPQGRVGHDVVGLAVGVVVDVDGHELEAVLDHEPPGHGVAVRRPHGRPRPTSCRSPPAAGAASRPGRRRPAPGPAAVGTGVGTRAARGWRRRWCCGGAHERRRQACGGSTARSRAARSTSTACGRNSCSGRLRWMRSPRSTWARRSGPSDWATSMRRPSSTP